MLLTTYRACSALSLGSLWLRVERCDCDYYAVSDMWPIALQELAGGVRMWLRPASYSIDRLRIRAPL